MAAHECPDTTTDQSPRGRVSSVTWWLALALMAASHSPHAWAADAPLNSTTTTTTTTTLASQAPGLRIMGDLNQGNCTSCHVVPGLSGVAGRFGPSLEGVASRWTPQQLRQWVFDARVLRPNTLMPPFGTLEGLHSPWPKQPILSTEQIDQVVRTLETFR